MSCPTIGTKTDRNWLASQRQHSASDELFITACLRGDLRTTARNAATATLATAHPSAAPTVGDPAMVADQILRTAGADYTEHRVYADELSRGDVIHLPDAARDAEVHDLLVSFPGDPAVGVTIWFTGDQEPWNVPATTVFTRTARNTLVDRLTPGHRVIYSGDVFEVDRVEPATTGDLTHVWFTADPTGLPWTADPAMSVRIRTAPPATADVSPRRRAPSTLSGLHGRTLS